MPTQEAFANLLAARALAGDAKAMALLIRLVDLGEDDPKEANAREQVVRLEDELVMASIVRRIRAMDEPAADSSPPGDQTP